MKWLIIYKWLIFAGIIAIVKYFQQKKQKKFNLYDNDKIKVESSKLRLLMIELINEKKYILISDKEIDERNYEITFVNYKQKLFDCMPTYIKILVSENSKEASYTIWSDRYEYGQNSRNNDIANDFLHDFKNKLKEIDTGN